jgi:hypothetical protein
LAAQCSFWLCIENNVQSRAGRRLEPEKRVFRRFAGFKPALRALGIQDDWLKTRDFV